MGFLMIISVMSKDTCKYHANAHASNNNGEPGAEGTGDGTEAGDLGKQLLEAVGPTVDP